MQRILVMSRADAQTVCREHLLEGTPFAIVSIANPAEPGHHVSFARFAKDPDCKAIKRIAFEDIEEDMPPFQAMTIKDALAIHDFVARVKDGIDVLIVHCQGGVSRSAGVAAALGRIFLDNDDFVWKDPRFCPNMLCHRLMFEAAGRTWDEKHWMQIAKEQSRLFLNDFWKKENRCPDNTSLA